MAGGVYIPPEHGSEGARQGGGPVVGLERVHTEVGVLHPPK